jgi:Leucine-rich repeat (LRR) protein
METLQLHNCRLNDITPIRNMTKLKIFNVFTELEIPDLAPFSRLTALNELIVCDLIESDFSLIADLVHLTKLSLGTEKVSNLEGLSRMTSLEILDLHNSNVSDIQALSGLVMLKRLDLHGTQVRDISPLAGLVNLQSVDLRGTNVVDISPLAHLNQLEIIV